MSLSFEDHKLDNFMYHVGVRLVLFIIMGSSLDDAYSLDSLLCVHHSLDQNGMNRYEYTNEHARIIMVPR